MFLEQRARESRRSTRVFLKVRIEAKGVTEFLTREGETIIVNLHGARMSTTVPLPVGMKIQIHVILTDKHALAQVVYVDPDWPPALWNRTRKTREYLGSVSCT